MKKYDDLWNELNTLLTYLDRGSVKVTRLVNDFYFGNYGNSAPASLLQEQIDIIQKRLDEAPEC